VILDKIIFIKDQQTFQNAAHVRIVNKTPPALKKGEYKDCFIWESFYQTTKNRDSFSNFSFFISSNKQDYCELPHNHDFHPKLESEISGMNIYYAFNFTKLYDRLLELKIVTKTK